MNAPASTTWAFWKSQSPVIAMVLAMIVAMNAKDVVTFGVAVFVVAVMIVYLTVQRRRRKVDTGAEFCKVGPPMQLGSDKGRPLWAVTGVMVLVLGLLFTPVLVQESSTLEGVGIACICLAIGAAFFVPVFPRRGRMFAFLFALGFTVASIAYFLAAVRDLQVVMNPSAVEQAEESPPSGTDSDGPNASRSNPTAEPGDTSAESPSGPAEARSSEAGGETTVVAEDKLGGDSQRMVEKDGSRIRSVSERDRKEVKVPTALSVAKGFGFACVLAIGGGLPLIGLVVAALRGTQLRSNVIFENGFYWQYGFVPWTTIRGATLESDGGSTWLKVPTGGGWTIVMAVAAEDVARLRGFLKSRMPDFAGSTLPPQDSESPSTS